MGARRGKLVIWFSLSTWLRSQHSRYVRRSKTLHSLLPMAILGRMLRATQAYPTGRFDKSKSTIAVACVSTFDLDSDLRNLARAWRMPRIRMDTNQIVAFVVWGSFVGQDVSAHQIPVQASFPIIEFTHTYAKAAGFPFSKKPDSSKRLSAISSRLS